MKVLVTGSEGLVGSSVIRVLKNSPKVSSVVPSSRKDTNLFDKAETKNLINETKPDVLVNCAARVGGIHATQIDQILY